ERTAISSGVHFKLAKLDDVIAAGNLFPDSLVGVQRVAALVDIGKMNRVTDANRTVIRLFLPRQHLEQGRFTGAVRADHTDNATRGQLEVQIVDQETVAIAFRQALNLDDHLTEALADRNDDLRIAGATLFRTLDQFVIGLDTRLGLG